MSQTGIPGVVGAIDGSHIEIKQPIGNATDFYNRKSVHSIILQGEALPISITVHITNKHY